MSFKREGNDGSQLKILQKRRIKDLLGIAVPEDEALLTSNGRLACLVCGHRPVFDTVDMLVLHRGGKKHCANAEYENTKKQEIKDLIAKRKHEQYMVDGTTDVQQAPDKKKGLGMGVPYDPRSKSKKPKLYDRKQKVDLSESVHNDVPEASNPSSLPGSCHYRNHKEQVTPQSESEVAHFNTYKPEIALNNKRSKFTNSADDCQKAYSLKDNTSKNDKDKKEMTNESFRTMLLKHQLEVGPMDHPAQLKQIFSAKTSVEVNLSDVRPYISNRDTTHQNVDVKSSIIGNSTSRESFSTMKTNSSELDSYNFTENEQVKPIIRTGDIIQLAMNPPPPPPQNLSSQQKTNKSRKGSHSNKKSKEDITLSIEQKQKVAQYLQCRGAGWKKDLCGKWVKDEDAEFDSDEEPPDLP